MLRSVVVDDFRRRWVVIAVCVLLTGCSFLGEQVAISSAHSCIQRQCKAEQGKARQQCMTSCQRQYGP